MIVPPHAGGGSVNFSLLENIYLLLTGNTVLPPLSLLSRDRIRSAQHFSRLHLTLNMSQQSTPGTGGTHDTLSGGLGAGLGPGSWHYVRLMFTNIQQGCYANFMEKLAPNPQRWIFQIGRIEN